MVARDSAYASSSSFMRERREAWKDSVRPFFLRLWWLVF